ncbi:MAG: hypothetical protein H3C62_09170 [Gemmatimonadaceae bacterium]|nr:hypothetical protein [Gemmatimonadaceae bacterium]
MPRVAASGEPRHERHSTAASGGARLLPVGSPAEKLAWLRRQRVPTQEAITVALQRKRSRRLSEHERNEAASTLWAACGRVTFASLRRVHQRLEGHKEEAEERVCDLIADVVSKTEAKSAPQFFLFAHRRIACLYEEMARRQRSPHRLTTPLFSAVHADALEPEASEEDHRVGAVRMGEVRLFANATESDNFVAPAADLLENRQALEAFLLVHIAEAVPNERNRTILRHWLGLAEFQGRPMESSAALGQAYNLTRQRIDQLIKLLFVSVKSALGY